MRELTSYERVANALARKPVDRVPVAVSPWKSTIRRWREQGHLGEDEDVFEHFNQDVRLAGWPSNVVDLDWQTVVIEETEETILTLDANGAKLRRHKLHDSTPEHVDFTVKDRKSWEEFARPRLTVFDRRRVDFEGYRRELEFARERQRYFYWIGLAPFEQMHPLCGHEHMLIGMAVDPDWVKDMVRTYVSLTITHLEQLFSECGRPDAMFFCNDMGFKQKPFISPAMYREIVMPGDKRLFDFAHSMGCPVIMHSCGYVEPLVPGYIEAGIGCLEAMEVKAGMDLPRLFKRFGDKISFYGGFDVRALASNDRRVIDEELHTRVLPVIESGGGYVLHSDHSEPPEVEHETMHYFIDRGIEMSRAQ